MKKLISIITLTAIAAAASGMDYRELYGRIKQQSGGADTHVYDPDYTSISEQGLKQVMIDHFGMTRQYAPLGKKNELFDCDDYAFTFKAMVSYHGRMFGRNFGCGVLTVKNEKAFAGVPAGGYHALNVILLEGVLYVLEPQTYEYTPLFAYPNRDNIIGLIL